MGASKVYVNDCHEYDSNVIQTLIADGLSNLDLRLPRASKVLIKPNVLSPHSPDRAITTHPAMIEAMARLLLDNSNEVIIADSCGQPGGTANALKQTQILDIKERLPEVSIRPFEEYPSRVHSNPDNKYLKEVSLPTILDEVEGVINMPKLKSHMLTKLTASVKNLFGCIPGGGKQQAHVIAPSAEEFSELLIELYGFIQPRVLLNVIDAIVGLHGFGPGPAGHPTPVGFIGMSQDAVALDVACCGAVGLAPHDVIMLRIAIERGLSSGEVDANKTPARVPFSFPKPFPLRTFLFKHVSGAQRRKPKLIQKKCKKCGVCAKVCPAKCIKMDVYPQWDYSACIYCYCCHENCPHAAIKLKRSLFS
jgi:uncharacterized protein (DUF362 family)/Pyruvate/2-oxoacid:ferredoxin oxidoreductase delta subunit